MPIERTASAAARWTTLLSSPSRRRRGGERPGAADTRQGPAGGVAHQRVRVVEPLRQVAQHRVARTVPDAENLPRAGNGVALVIEKAFDAQSHFHIATAVQTLPGAALVRFELRKLALPETQDVGGNIAEPGDFADAEVELVRDVGPGGWGSFADWLMLCHARNSDTTAPAAVAYGPA